MQSKEQLRHNTLNVTLDHVIDNLLKPPKSMKTDNEPDARDIVVKGSFDEVNAYFYEHELSDGLPIVPPTIDKVEQFLRYTDRAPDESLGTLLPDSRAATIWSIAVNGVMAGCRPEYMPVLVALIEAMADHTYGVEHSGNTPGGETLIILNGPIVKSLGFNYTQGVMRDGFMANTAVGRFWRLYLRNVAGFLPHKNDKATFGNTWRVVVAENEDVVKKIGWTSTSADFGFYPDDSTVMISRHTGGNHISSVSGATAQELMPYICDAVVRQYSWQVMFAVGQGYNTLRPQLLISPLIAESIAASGWTKRDFQNHLFEHARMPAHQFERILGEWTQKPTWNLKTESEAGRIPKIYFESNDPNRLVPLVWEPKDFLICVTGDPARTAFMCLRTMACSVFPHARKSSYQKTGMPCARSSAVGT